MLSLMKYIISVVGKDKAPSPTHQLYDEYASRLRASVQLYEVECKKKQLPPHERKRQEALLLLDTVPDGAVVVALDERGKAFTSQAFAKKLQTFQDDGRSSIVFMIGGAYGHGEAVTDRADMLLSLGSMTWPHKLAKAMLAEQLYRATTIIEGHPYHKE